MSRKTMAALLAAYTVLDDIAFASRDELPALNARYTRRYTVFVSCLKDASEARCDACRELCDVCDLAPIPDELLDAVEEHEGWGNADHARYCDDCRLDWQYAYGERAPVYHVFDRLLDR